MLIIGEKEVTDENVSVRDRDTDQTTSMTLPEFIALCGQKIANRD